MYGVDFEDQATTLLGILYLSEPSAGEIGSHVDAGISDITPP